MQIACKRYDCQKAVEVCYWSCKFRKNCKDWESALIETPGVNAIRERLEAAARKSGRAFDPKSLIFPARKKKKQPDQKHSRGFKGTMSNLSAVELIESDQTEWEQEIPASASEKTAASKAKPKAAKPKLVNKPVNNNGPIYLLLFSNGKYKELHESELNTEAAGVLKDQTLRLVKGQCLVPQISFKVADEE